MIRQTNKIVRDFATEQMATAVDDAVMSIDPVALEKTMLLSRVEDKSALDVILFYPLFGLGEQQIRDTFKAWIDSGRHISLTCLPGGLMRADTNVVPGAKTQTVDGQFNRALRCHPRAGM